MFRLVRARSELVQIVIIVAAGASAAVAVVVVVVAAVYCPDQNELRGIGEPASSWADSSRGLKFANGSLAHTRRGQASRGLYYY